MKQNTYTILFAASSLVALLCSPAAFSKDEWKQTNKGGQVSDEPQFPAWSGWSDMVDDWGHKFRHKADLECQVPPAATPEMDRILIHSGLGYGFVDLTGKVVIEPLYCHAGQFSNGLSAVQEKPRARWKVIDKNAIVRYQLPKDLEADGHVAYRGPSKEGLMPVKRGTLTALYDFHKNQFYPVGDLTVIRDFSEGLAAFNSVHRSMKSGYLNTDGQVAIENFDFARDFHEGLAAVLLDHRWNYIDHSGKVVIELPADCSYADSFCEGLAAVALGGQTSRPFPYLEVNEGARWGFIDKTGKLAIPAKYYAGECPHFSEGLAHVAVGDEINHKYGFIDKKGNFVIQPAFKSACEFNNGYARICLGQTGFSQEDWNTRRGPFKVICRQSQFDLFLKQYGLLGMHRNEVHNLLGEPSQVPGIRSSTFRLQRQGFVAILKRLIEPNQFAPFQFAPFDDYYALDSGPCGNSYRRVEIHYENDIVTEYRYYSFEKGAEEWIGYSWWRSLQASCLQLLSAVLGIVRLRVNHAS